MHYLPFKVDHVFQMRLQPAQTWMEPYFDRAALTQLENGWATTIMRGGEPVLCGGALELWPGRAMLWSFISGDLTPRDFIKAHHIAKQHIDLMPFRRLEFYVEVDFGAGHRWARSLGFDLEAPCMRGFQIDGRDCALYARVKE